jgi:cytochrome c-type biogenesis protein CcmH
MNHRFATVGLLFVVAGLSIPQTSTTYLTPDIKRVGDKLACKCGSCNNTVATCQMLACHYTGPAREKIAAMQKEGASDQAVIDNFIKEVGIAALASPPAEGFNLLGWVMPFAALLLGLIPIFVYMKRFRRQPAPGSDSPPVPVIDEKYRKKIEADMAELD